MDDKFDVEIYSLVWTMRGLAASLPEGWRDRPSAPVKTFHDANGGVVSSALPAMNDVEARRRWHRERNGERARKLRDCWAALRGRFGDALATRVDAALERAVGIQGRQSADTLGDAQELADDLRELAELLKASEPRRIPAEHKSDPHSKDELARIHSSQKQSNPTRYLKDRGLTIEGEPGSKLWYVDVREWPEHKRDKLRS
ncbi:hypothetical protein OAS39_06380 [Pirellulales bacterium]|nr:hypothetical protein [Pirellulales bacterium]